MATAKLFLEQGAKVAITGTKDETVRNAVQELQAHKDNLLGVQADLGEVADIDRVISAVKDKFGGLDVAFLNHGISEPASILEADIDCLHRQFNVNFFSPYLTLQKAAKIMSNPGSVILNASISGSSGMPGQTIYGATKAAVRSLARTASMDLKDKGIRVNAVSPGVIETPILGKQGLGEEELEGFRDGFKQATVLGRTGRPEEIAYTVLFLATQESSFIVGEEILVDGGYKTT